MEAVPITDLLDTDILISKLEKLHKFQAVVRPLTFHVIWGFRLLKSFVIRLYFVYFCYCFMKIII